MGSYAPLSLVWSTYGIYLELFFMVSSDLCAAFIQLFIYINVDSLVLIFLVIIWFIYFVAWIVLAFPMGTLLFGYYAHLIQPYQCERGCSFVFLSIFWLSATMRFPGQPCVFSSPALDLAISPKELSFHLLENGVRNQNLGTWCACCYWYMINFRLFSWWSKELYACILTCGYTHIFKYIGINS